jgi:4-diphosphocytidyl-2-C-methyl-D-erythritol kinase
MAKTPWTRGQYIACGRNSNDPRGDGAYNSGVLSTPAHAKINLLLNVLGRFPNGYHDLEMVNVSIDLADHISIETSDRPEIVIRVEGAPPSEPLPDDDRNIAMKALRRICAERGIEPNFRILIVKRIPVGAGLAGGSTDAAAVLRLMGEDVPNRDAIALEIGADVPFCLHRGPAIVRGVGEKITPLALGAPLHLALVNPGFSVATRAVFQEFPSSAYRKSGHGDAFAATLASGDIDRIAKELENDLQSVTTRLHPAVGTLVHEMRAAGAAGVLMSGSGPTVFGVFRDAAAAQGAAAWFAPRVPFACACGTVS